MPRLAALLLCIAAFVGCELIGPSEGASETDRDRFTETAWRLDAINDAHDGVWHVLDQADRVEVLTFIPNGAFVQQRIGGCCNESGRWSLDANDSRLTLDYAGGWTSEAVYTFYQLETVGAPLTLLLALPGRHGHVTYRYVAEAHP
ncbi:MAG: hypothetical protein AAGJ10_16285 [Bacteroidota bacterium]